jgi:hypothetical protein
MWWLLALWLFQPITSETPVTVTLTAGAGPVDVIYSAAPDEVLTVIARSTAAEPIDVTLEMLQDNERIAFNDDRRSEIDDLAPQDAAITNLYINEAGDYTLRIHSFSGAQSGEVEVIVRSSSLVEACETGAVELLPHRAFRCTLDVQAAQTLTVTARDTSGTLDPVLTLLDSDGTLLVQNDDHTSADLTLNVLDAQITSYEVTEAGAYTLQVSDFGGAAGTLDLLLDIES